MAYVDGFVIAVPKENRDKFIHHANVGDDMFMELGATRILECWEDDVPDGKMTDFRRAVQATADEAVVFSWIEWPDKETRDKAMAVIMSPDNTDPRMDPAQNPIPFDGKRMIFGGFAPVVTMRSDMANKHGDFIWYELMTSDPDGAAAFYGPLLGWTFGSAHQPGMGYRQFTAADGEMVGGCMKMPDGAPMPPMWLGYIGVDNVDACAASIRSAGGQVHMEPQDIPGVGRFAFVADPQGVPFYIMRGASDEVSTSFAYETPKDGHCAWNELSTTDPTAAIAFYTGQFGWVQDGDMDMGPLGKYAFIRHGEQIGAIMPKMPEQPVPAWTYYFRVPDIDAAKSGAEAGGGQVFHGPSEVPGGDFIISGIDPQGAMFSLVGKRAS